MNQLEVQTKLVGFQSQALTDLSTATISRQANEILQALTTGAIIANCSDDEVRKALVTGIVLSGVKDEPDETMLKLIVNSLRKYFTSYTASEIVLAFQLNSAGQLSKRVEAFNNFDLAFVTKVADLYGNLRRSARKELSLNVKKIEEPKEATAEDLIEYLKAHKNDLPLIFEWNKVFMHLEAKGEIKMTLKDKQKLFKIVYNENLEKKLDPFTNFTIDSNYQAWVKSECRKKEVIRWLNR
jgi:hypothetical protein